MRTPARTLLAALAVVALVAVVLAGCATPLTQAQAQEKAIAAFIADEELEGPPGDVIVLEITETTRTGYRGWDVRLSGVVVLPGLPDGMLVTETVFVTADDGATQIVARG